MSLLDQGDYDIKVFPEYTYYDEDGNLMTWADFDNPVPARAAIQPAAQSGTSSRRHEQNQEGFETESVYWMRLTRDFPFRLQAQSAIEWEGNIWWVMGDAYVYRSSRRTSHNEYTIRRS